MKIFQRPRNKNHTGRKGRKVTNGIASHAKPVFTAFTSLVG
jgi:hypothetical protein